MENKKLNAEQQGIQKHLREKEVKKEPKGGRIDYRLEDKGLARIVVF